ncbi:pyridoxamine 5'-phosphate oxidase family protein [Salinicoccus halitifaciens]|uniref:General stress protein 26 n=1 Tax=Salinicoccus halitifaciens TaxID=1073415 RepID=A0ABV2ED51_9STAP|nr:pyridoxamine 5'-phosphate oxidase family protein [Salinicoccus halitifaciens]MCD2138745.1 pyridoxamine 5'-phosphate oxidase family protein [Salinicoccus halitifaciens]
MEQEKVIEEIENILEVSRVGVMSTISGDKPNSRYMIFYNDGHTLYTKTSKDTLKVDEIEKNPNTHVLLGYEETSNDSFLEVDGKVEIVEDQETLDHLWENQDKTYFDSKDDPDFIVLKIEPESIKVMNDKENLDTPAETVDFTK